ncbi:zinc-binding alcohol dehydrogenase family protein [Kribbella hippodromi]|uniref:zinc-binding alcohol dehydrogenase family protein n=1 Tax=Kribbella hippodromi TaxID=434347 RepID=UPI0031DC89C1
MAEEMQAWVVERPGPIDGAPLRKVRRPVPEPGPGEVLVEVEGCGICRTDLHLCEGDLPPKHPGVIPGHQAVGTVVSRGRATNHSTTTDRTTNSTTNHSAAANADGTDTRDSTASGDHSTTTANRTAIGDSAAITDRTAVAGRAASGYSTSGYSGRGDHSGSADHTASAGSGDRTGSSGSGGCSVSADRDGAGRFGVGDRVGIAWLRGTCGVCEFCRRGVENLCARSAYTGWDADGGFAEYAVVPEDFAYALPTDRPAIELAPFLCAGIIGYRSLLRANLPPGGRLGIYGFGSSAHLTAQLATAQGAELFVMTRGEQNRVLARALGAVFVGETADRPPVPLDSAIVFAPAGDVVPYALEAVRPGGTVAVAGIHLSDVPALNYERHLFHERDLRSVTSNTRRDGEELFRLIERLDVSAHTTAVPFGAVDRALADVAHGRASGSLVALR